MDCTVRNKQITTVSCQSLMGRKGTPFPHLQFLAHSVSPPQTVYYVRERHTTIVRGPNLNVAFIHLNFCTLTTDDGDNDDDDKSF